MSPPTRGLIAALIVGAAFTVTPALRAQSAAVAEGDVVKVDPSAGMITIRHGPIAALGMTGATATDDFKVGEPIMLNALSAGEHIKFAAERVDGQLVLTKIVL